jgi:hypothetical protein
MTPEDYEDNLIAAKAHAVDHTLNMIDAAHHAMSPTGFKYPARMLKDRNRQIQKLINNRNVLLKAFDQYKQNETKVNSDRSKLKQMFQSELKAANNGI